MRRAIRIGRIRLTDGRRIQVGVEIREGAPVGRRSVRAGGGIEAILDQAVGGIELESFGRLARSGERPDQARLGNPRLSRLLRALLNLPDDGAERGVGKNPRIHPTGIRFRGTQIRPHRLQKGDGQDANDDQEGQHHDECDTVGAVSLEKGRRLQGGSMHLN